jgi:hypothetical protein
MIAGALNLAREFAVSPVQIRRVDNQAQACASILKEGDERFPQELFMQKVFSPFG